MDPNAPGNNWQDVPNTGAGGTPPADPGGYVPPPPPSSPPPGYQQQGYPPPPPQGYPPQGYGQPQAGGLSPNAAAAIAYLTFIPAVIFLVLEPYRRIPLVKFHAYQCIGLTLVSIVISVVRSELFRAFGLFGILFGLLHLVLFVFWLICIISAAQGKWFKVPVIGDFALKQAQTP